MLNQLEKIYMVIVGIESNQPKRTVKSKKQELTSTIRKRLPPTGAAKQLATPAAQAAANISVVLLSFS